MNRLIAKYLVYWPVQLVRGQSVLGRLRRAKALQYKGMDEIEALRDRRIHDIIRYAYDVTYFYRERFDGAGVDPGEVLRGGDLARLPVLSKREILANEQRMIASREGAKLYTRKTGGSTGMTLHFKKEASSLAENDAIMYRCYAWYGIDVGDRQVRFWGVPVTVGLRWRERIKDFILNRIRVSAFDISEASCLDHYRRIVRFCPDYFYGYTTAIYGFCLFMKRLGLDLKRLPLKAVICTAEKMYDHHRALFREVFACPIVDEYGSSENGVIAFECVKGSMHVMADHLFVEFLNEEGRPAAPGELGRIVVTDLASYAMPLIRYEIGDMGRPSASQCSCGVNLPLMEIVEGRKEDFIRTRDGRLIHAAYLCYTLKDDAVSEFKMYQKGLEKFQVLLVKSSKFGSDTEALLEGKLRTALGSSVDIKFEYVDRIPREASGKLRYFVSEMGNN